MPPSLSGVVVNRRSLPPVPAAALLVVVEIHRAFDTRLVTVWLSSGALPWAAGSAATLVGTSGSGKRRFVCPVFVRRSMSGMHRRARKRFSLDFKNRFFWRIQKKWFLENTSQRRSLWLTGSRASALSDPPPPAAAQPPPPSRGRRGRSPGNRAGSRPLPK